MVSLDSRLTDVLGGRTAKPLEKAFGMRTVRDLLSHYPRRMAERGELTDLASLQIDEEVTVVAEVKSCVVRRAASGQRVEVTISDGRGTLQLVFFGNKQVNWRTKELVPGRRGLFSGKVNIFNKRLQLVHPEYMVLAGDATDVMEADIYAGRLIPVYPATQAVRTWHVSNSVHQALAVLEPVPDPMPAEIRARHGLASLGDALHSMHEPADFADWGRARRRLKWDEAMGVQLALAQRRHAALANPATPRPAKAGGLLDAFDARLPFRLTDGQRDVGATVADELADEHPMHRLLQGEVGSGKTVVALRAMLQVVDAGGQAVLLAPTEVLAGQHARTIETLLGPLAQGGRLFPTLAPEASPDSKSPDSKSPDSKSPNSKSEATPEHATRVALLTGSLPAAARRAALLEAASGEAGIVVGTHALIQEHVSFADLGLVVVDEQHRFGVEQRDALRGKAAKPPHLLVMTATPIPRTVAMTVFGDLETSTLRELPLGRAPISTSVVPVAERPAWLDRAWARIREEAAEGRQAYVVCPRIGADMSDFEEEFADLDTGKGAPGRGLRPPLAVSDLLPMLADGPLHGLRLAPLHSRLTTEEKDLTMADFAAGRLDVLVATTVVEVGVDVPNATVMAIMDADRFGVSQLHQLRGRIGRGGHAGLCLLVTEAPPAAPARERLDAVAATTDGFALARLDVEQRSEGDILGAAQSGRRRQLRLLSLLRDEDLITGARAEAANIVAADPDLSAHPLLAAQVAALVDEEQAEYLEKG